MLFLTSICAYWVRHTYFGAQLFLAFPLVARFAWWDGFVSLEDPDELDGYRHYEARFLGCEIEYAQHGSAVIVFPPWFLSADFAQL